jgi:hypothetical protein
MHDQRTIRRSQDEDLPSAGAGRHRRVLRGALGSLLVVATAACNNSRTSAKPEQEPIAKTDAVPAAAAAKATKASPESYTFDHKPTTAAPGAADAVGAAKSAAKAAVQPPGTQASKGPAVSGEGFSAHLQATGTFEVGKASSVQVVLDAAPPFHCNDKYPYKFTLTKTPGLTFPADVVRDMKIGESQSTMTVPFTPDQPGAKTLTGELAFSVCTDDKCLIEKQQLSVTIDIKGAS